MIEKIIADQGAQATTQVAPEIGRVEGRCGINRGGGGEYRRHGGSGTNGDRAEAGRTEVEAARAEPKLDGDNKD